MPSSTQFARIPFRPDLQGLRALAILLVVLAHAGIPWLAGGFIGVDVFFVLSGYLITGLLLQEFEANGQIGLIRFYARRLKRLLPALIVMVVVTAAAAFWLLSNHEAQAQLASSPFAATWTSNLYFFFTTMDYFDELAMRDLFLHTWSLGVEEQFYLVWPVVLLGLILAGPLGKLIRGLRATIIVLGLVGLASLALSIYLSSRWPQAAFYLMPSRIWQFALGAMVFVAFWSAHSQPDEINNNKRIFLRNWAWLALIGGLALIVGSAIGLHPNMVYPGYWAILPSVGAALTITAGHGLAEGRMGPLANPGLIWLGDRSYSLYLWHWPVLMLGFSLGFQGQILPTIGLILFSILMAILSYRFVELPFWKGRYSRHPPVRVLLISVFLMAAVVALLFHTLRPEPEAANSVDISLEWRTDVPVIYKMSCDAWYHHARVEPCIFGDQEATKTVVLLGDSIGAQWFSLVPAVFPAPQWLTVVLTKSACPIVDEDFFYSRIGKVYEVCAEWRNAVLEEIARQQPDVVIIGSAATYDFTEEQWSEGSARVFDKLSRSAEHVLVIPGTPNLGFDGPGCLTRHISDDRRVALDACKADDRLGLVVPVTTTLESVASRFSNVHVIDLNGLVCPDRVCSAVSSQGIVVFRDSQHLTDSFVRAQIPAVRKQIDALGW